MAAMQHIAECLKKLGMSDYTQRFVEIALTSGSFPTSRTKTWRNWDLAR
jgi:hypothetical protein